MRSLCRFAEDEEVVEAVEAEPEEEKGGGSEGGQARGGRSERMEVGDGG